MYVCMYVCLSVCVGMIVYGDGGGCELILTMPLERRVLQGQVGLTLAEKGRSGSVGACV